MAAKKEAAETINLLAVLKTLARHPEALTRPQQEQLRRWLNEYLETEILFYQPQLWPRLEKTTDFRHWLTLLIQFLQGSDSLAVEILDNELRRSGLVPDKFTLDQLAADLARARQQEAQIELAVAALMSRYQLDRATVEDALRLVFLMPLREEKKAPEGKEARVLPIVPEENRGQLLAEAAQALTRARPSLDGEQPLVDDLIYALGEVISQKSLPPPPAAALAVPSLALAGWQDTGRRLEEGLPPAERQLLLAMGRLGTTAPAATSLPADLRRRWQALPQPRQEQLRRILAFRQLTAQTEHWPLPRRRQAQENLSKRSWQIALGQMVAAPFRRHQGGKEAGKERPSPSPGKENLPPKKAFPPLRRQSEITTPAAAALAEIYLPLALPSPPGSNPLLSPRWWQRLKPPWQQLAKKMPPTAKTLRDAGQWLLASSQKNPALLKAALWEFSFPSRGEAKESPWRQLALWLHFQRAPGQNQRLINQLENLNQHWQQLPARHPLKFLRPFWQQQRQILLNVRQSRYYLWYQRFNPPPDSNFRFANLWALFLSPWRPRLNRWLWQKASSWGRRLAGRGIKKLFSGLFAKLGGLVLGLGGGPSGWLVTAFLGVRKLFTRPLKKLLAGFFGGGWKSNFLAALRLGTPAATRKKGNTFWWLLIFSFVPLIFIFLAIIIVAGALFNHSERGGAASSAYFNQLYRQRVNCQSNGDNPLAQRACQIENILRACQGGDIPRVTAANIDGLIPCWRRQGLAADVINYLRQGIVDGTLQCVGFAKAVVPWLRPVRVAAARDLADHFQSRPWGTIRPGDVVVNRGGEFGHVAVVSAVIQAEVGEPVVVITQADGYQGTVFSSKIPLSSLRQGNWVLLKPPD